MKKKIRSSRPALEMLEDRSVPAVAAVNLVGGDLVITTDASSDTYTLNFTADNTVEVSDGGGLEGSFSGVTGQLSFTGLAGADNVVLNLNGFTLDADVVASMGGDDDRFTINGGGGAMNGAINIDLDGDDDHVAINNVTINNDISILAGGGANCLIIGGVQPVEINGNVDIDAGDDGNQVRVEGAITGDLTIVTGAGADDINLDDLNIVGDIGVTAGDGANEVSLTDSTIHGDVKIAMGADSDRLSIDPVILFGDLTVLTGGGENCVNIDALYLSGGLLYYGAGSDHIRMTDSVLAGSSSFNMEGEGASINLTIEDTTLATFLSVVTGHESDEVKLSNVVVGQNFAAVMGGGCDQLTICGGQIQGDLLHEGMGKQEIAIHDAQILGHVTLNTADVDEDASSSKVRISGTTIGRWLSITSGSGNDCVQVSDSSIGGKAAFDLGDGCDSLDLCGVAIHSDFWQIGAGDQEVSLKDTQISGFASFNFLASDEVTMKVELDHVSVGQFLSVRGGEGSDHITLEEVSAAQNLGIDTGAGEDCVSIEDGLVTGSTTIDTGADGDSIRIKDGRFQGSFDVKAGDGNNNFTVDTRPNGDSTTFLGAFSYEGGTGDDTVILGDEHCGDEDFAVFAGSATFEGGTGEGTNTLVDDYAAFAEDPVVTNFVSVV